MNKMLWMNITLFMTFSCSEKIIKKKAAEVEGPNIFCCEGKSDFSFSDLNVFQLQKSIASAGQQYRGAETESWSEQAANTGKMPKLHWHYWWHPDLTQQTEEEMLVKLSVKTSAVLEKMHSSSWKTKVLLALSVKMGSVRTTQLLQIERKSTAFPGWYNLWRAEKANTG